jgi:hypothetical protein
MKVGFDPGSPEEKISKDWLMQRYHAPSDDANQPVDLAAAAGFEQVMRGLTVQIANDPHRLEWNKDSFFRRFVQGPTDNADRSKGHSPHWRGRRPRQMIGVVGMIRSSNLAAVEIQAASWFYEAGETGDSPLPRLSDDTPRRFRKYAEPKDQLGAIIHPSLADTLDERRGPAVLTG